MSPPIPLRAILDELCGDIVRSRGMCENPACQATEHLTWAHIFPRDCYPTRWRLDAAFCLCDRCRLFFNLSVNRDDWYLFVYNMIGEKKYNELKELAYSRRHVDMGKTLYDLKRYKKNKWLASFLTIDRRVNE